MLTAAGGSSHNDLTGAVPTLYCKDCGRIRSTGPEQGPPLIAIALDGPLRGGNLVPDQLPPIGLPFLFVVEHVQIQIDDLTQARRHETVSILGRTKTRPR